MSPPDSTLSESSREISPRGLPEPRISPNHVRVINPTWNGSPVVKLKAARHLVATGRAEMMGTDCLRIISSVEANKDAAATAAKVYNDIVRGPGNSEANDAYGKRLPANRMLPDRNNGQMFTPQAKGMRWKSRFKNASGQHIGGMRDAGRRYEPASR